VTQLFDLNARIQQLTWSLIFYEKYSTSLSTIVLVPVVVLTTANFGGFSNFCRYYTRSQAGKSTGYRPTLKPLYNAHVHCMSQLSPLHKFGIPHLNRNIMYMYLQLYMYKCFQFKALFRIDINHTYNTSSNELLKLTMVYNNTYNHAYKHIK
jgi:hypothetical protein